jgi:gluconolactonase
MPQLDLSAVSTFVGNLDHPEGLAFAEDGYLWAGGEAGQVYRISPDGREVRQVATTGGFCLGMAFDRAGNLYVCTFKRLAAVVKVTPSGQVSIFADEADGRKLRVPNFPVFDADGNLYVSDSGDWYGNNGTLCRFTPDGRGTVVAEPFNFTNGLALDARGEAIYVVESSGQCVCRLRIRPDGGVGEREVFVRGLERVPDGLAFDSRGTLYITCYASHRLYTADPTGRLAVLVEDPDGTALGGPTNCAFGGERFDELYIANLARDHIARLPLDVPGQPLHGGLRPG